MHARITCVSGGKVMIRCDAMRNLSHDHEGKECGCVNDNMSHSPFPRQIKKDSIN